eukprot:m.92319 g.92319  ORF g.92319 m.92319 type:complete len:96 (+) comp12033_c0_seq1:3204-3491(+)
MVTLSNAVLIASSCALGWRNERECDMVLGVMDRRRWPHAAAIPPDLGVRAPIAGWLSVISICTSVTPRSVSVGVGGWVRSLSLAVPLLPVQRGSH